MANTIMQLVATNSPRIRELPIKDGQLIFIQDLGRIAFDFKGNRVFYNQIVELETEADRIMLDNPLNGYYFIIGSGCLWHCEENEWTQITKKPKEVVHIDVELPQLGQAKEGVLYVNKADKEIAVFDSASNNYVIVSDYTHEASTEDIENLFN